MKLFLKNKLVRVATLPGKLKNHGKTWNLRNFEKKTWNFERKSLKNLKKPGILNNV